MKIAGKTDIGLVRAENQDSFATGEVNENLAWAVVCDGMGGHAGGSTASKMAVECISERIKSTLHEKMSVQSVRNMLESAILFANARIFNSACDNPSLKGMGTTVVAAVCTGNTAVVAWAGDSRCYHFANGSITQITKDHSFVQQLVDSGSITPEEANEHPMKNIITRALGLDDDVQVDFTDIEFAVSGDEKLILCTDGLTNPVSDKIIAECVSDGDCGDQAEMLVDLANKNGGTDNITVAIISA